MPITWIIGLHLSWEKLVSIYTFLTSFALLKSWRRLGLMVNSAVMDRADLTVTSVRFPLHTFVLCTLSTKVCNGFTAILLLQKKLR